MFQELTQITEMKCPKVYWETSKIPLTVRLPRKVIT